MRFCNNYLYDSETISGYHTRFVSKWDTLNTTRTTSSYSVLEQLSLELTGRDSGIESNDYDIEVMNRSYDYWN